MKELLDQLRDARAVQAKAKEAYLTAQREYEFVKSRAYLDHASDGHWKALHSVTIDKAVMRARERMDEAEMKQWLAWNDSSLIAAQLSAEKVLLQRSPEEVVE